MIWPFSDIVQDQMRPVSMEDILYGVNKVKESKQSMKDTISMIQLDWWNLQVIPRINLIEIIFAILPVKGVFKESMQKTFRFSTVNLEYCDNISAHNIFMSTEHEWSHTHIVNQHTVYNKNLDLILNHYW